MSIAARSRYFNTKPKNVKQKGCAVTQPKMFVKRKMETLASSEKSKGRIIKSMAACSRYFNTKPKNVKQKEGAFKKLKLYFSNL